MFFSEGKNAGELSSEFFLLSHSDVVGLALGQILLVESDLRREVLLHDVEDLPVDGCELLLIFAQAEARVDSEVGGVEEKAGERDRDLVGRSMAAILRCDGDKPAGDQPKMS